MQFSFNPTLSLTIPTGAGTGTSRMVLGQDIPAELKAYYSSSNAPFSMVVIAAQLFYSSNFQDAYYFYIAHLESVIGTALPCLGIGQCKAGVVAEKLFLDGTTNPYSEVVDLNWKDSTTGNDVDGFWTTLTPLNGWGNGAGQALQVRRVPSPSNSCMIVANLTTVGTTADGTLLFTLPAQFRPTNDIGIPMFSSATVAGGQSPHLDIPPSGNCTIWGVRGTAGFSAVYSLSA